MGENKKNNPLKEIEEQVNNIMFDAISNTKIKEKEQQIISFSEVKKRLLILVEELKNKKIGIVA